MGRIDVHMLVLGTEREDWKAQALASIPREICNVHVVDGIRGHLGRARARGYRQGTCEYVSFVDPDDWVESDTFERCLEFLDNHRVCGVVTEEIVHDYFRDITYRTRHKHGLSVYRRDWIEGFYRYFENVPVAADIRISARREVVLMPFVGRHWRKHASEAFLLRSASMLNSAAQVKRS